MSFSEFYHKGVFGGAVDFMLFYEASEIDRYEHQFQYVESLKKEGVTGKFSDGMPFDQYFAWLWEAYQFVNCERPISIQWKSRDRNQFLVDLYYSSIVNALTDFQESIGSCSKKIHSMLKIAKESDDIYIDPKLSEEPLWEIEFLSEVSESFEEQLEFGMCWYHTPPPELSSIACIAARRNIQDLGDKMGVFEDWFGFGPALATCTVKKPEETEAITTTGEKVGSVYLAQSDLHEFTKIGFSVKPKLREKTLQSEDPGLHFVHVFEGVPMSSERQLHKQFKEQRKRGEWFFLLPQDIETIKKQMKGIAA